MPNVGPAPAVTGRLYYESGALRYEGSYIPDTGSGYERYLEGTQYYEDGRIWRTGRFQRGGLKEGREYYPSGQLMFEGSYNDRETGQYYGPPYPVSGKFYLEDGTLLYDGRVRVARLGGVGYPHVVLPDGYLCLR